MTQEIPIMAAEAVIVMLLLEEIPMAAAGTLAMEGGIQAGPTYMAETMAERAVVQGSTTRERTTPHNNNNDQEEERERVIERRIEDWIDPE